MTGLFRSATSKTCSSVMVAPGWRYAAGIAGGGVGFAGGMRPSGGGCQGVAGLDDTRASTSRVAQPGSTVVAAITAIAANVARVRAPAVFIGRLSRCRG